MYTTPGWSNQVARVYLKSLLEFTHPGYTNDGVTSLGTTSGAGSGGVYRNITQGGLQEEAGFTERADGVLVYVPGWGIDGILLGLAGGTNVTYVSHGMAIIILGELTLIRQRWTLSMYMISQIVPGTSKVPLE